MTIPSIILLINAYIWQRGGSFFCLNLDYNSGTRQDRSGSGKSGSVPVPPTNHCKFWAVAGFGVYLQHIIHSISILDNRNHQMGPRNFFFSNYCRNLFFLEQMLKFLKFFRWLLFIKVGLGGGTLHLVDRSTVRAFPNYCLSFWGVWKEELAIK